MLATEVTSRETTGASIRVRAAGFGTVKPIEDVNFEHHPEPNATPFLYLATGTYLQAASIIVLLRPPGNGKTHLSMFLGVKAAQQGRRVPLSSATDWVNRLADAHQAGHPASELKHLGR